MASQNRVLLPLPDRYEKAKNAVALLEKRERLIRNQLWALSDQRMARVIESILDGNYDDA